MCLRAFGNFCAPFEDKGHHYKQKETCRVTGVALAIFSLCFLGVGCYLISLGMSPKMMRTGMQLIPQLGGWFLTTVAIGCLGLSLLAGGAYLYH
ncbi:MAG: hypothetical protein ACKVOH_05305, partial [Chlamydiales bacterium]